MSAVAHEKIETTIVEQLARPDLTPDDVLTLTIARRLNTCSDHVFAQALLGAGAQSLGFRSKR